MEGSFYIFVLYLKEKIFMQLKCMLLALIFEAYCSKHYQKIFYAFYGINTIEVKS